VKPDSAHLRGASAPRFTRALSLTILGWATLLGAALLAAMLWQGIASTRATDRQEILTALDHALAQLRELTLSVETTADSAERIVRTVRPASAERLRTALEMALAAFEQRPELSHLDVILPDTGEYGNLERADDGSILLWLYPGGKREGAVARSLRLTDTGFVPNALHPGKGYDPRIRPAYQAAIQGSDRGAWLPAHPWIVHGDQVDPQWGLIYVRALSDDAGHLLAVLDINFDLSALQTYVAGLQTLDDVQLDVIELGDAPVRIAGRGVAHQPLALSRELTPLLAGARQAFAEPLWIDGERRWVAARTLALQGGVSWLMVASRVAPLLDASLRQSLTHALGMLLIVIAVVALIARRMAQRFSQPLEYIATHDDLTGLPNRLLLQKRIRQCIDHQTDAALLCLDLDRFKVINDSYGHLFGNRVLNAVGETLHRLARPQDTVAHVSGDSFLILLPGADAQEAADIAHRILQTLRRPAVVEGRSIHLSASIGMSLYPRDGKTVEALISTADLAMYRAKQLGRNTVQAFTQALQQETQQRLALEHRLRDAVADNQLHLVYQPKVSLNTGRITGCEALLRWTHPELGTIPPSRFIPIAEDCGLILPIGDWVLTTACTQAKAWLDAGLAPVRVAVNLSARQFLRQDVVAWVADTLKLTGLPADCLELELTESLFPRDIQTAIQTLAELRALGVRLSIDDFGTGYSNLSYLKRFHVHTLKIDQGFVRNAITIKQDAAIVHAIIDLAHTLNFTAVAEGVETREHVQFLRAQQCDEMQGYYFSAPVPPEAFAQLLRDGVRLAS